MSGHNGRTEQEVRTQRVEAWISQAATHAEESGASSVGTSLARSHGPPSQASYPPEASSTTPSRSGMRDSNKRHGRIFPPHPARAKRTTNRERGCDKDEDGGFF